MLFTHSNLLSVSSLLLETTPGLAAGRDYTMSLVMFFWTNNTQYANKSALEVLLGILMIQVNKDVAVWGQTQAKYYEYPTFLEARNSIPFATW